MFLSRSFSWSIFKSVFFSFFVLIFSGCGEVRKTYGDKISIAEGRFVFNAGIKEVCIPYEGDLESSGVENLLVMIHDDSLNPVFFMSKGVYIADYASQNSTYVIAPQFLERRALNKDKGMLFWDRRWKEGGNSISIGVNKGYPKVSSFTALEQLVNYVYQQNKNTLKNVVIVGYGSGAQFTLQFASMNFIEDKLAAQDIKFRYVTAGASSYLYLNGERFKEENGRISPLSSTQLNGCLSYNSFKYGLDKIYGYGSSINAQQIRSNILKRDIIFVVGRQDLDRSLSLGSSCGAEIQGENRLERSILYKHHLKRIGSGELPNHKWLFLDKAGDNADVVFSAPAVIEAIFNGL